MTVHRIPARVRPLYAGDDWTFPAPQLTDARGVPVIVGSRTAAIKACRSEGYRVITSGGLVELSADASEWVVTVHPERD